LAITGRPLHSAARRPPCAHKPATAGTRVWPGTAWDTPSIIWATSPTPPPATRNALSLLRECGDRVNEADILTRLRDTRHAAGELAQARETWQQALAILEHLQYPGADQVRAKLIG
jgi:hypothetical protein